MILKADPESRITVRVEVPEGLRILSMEHTFVLSSHSGHHSEHQFQLFSTESTEIVEADGNGQRHLWPVPVDPPYEPVVRPRRRSVPPKQKPKRVSLWKAFKSKAVQDSLSAHSKMTGHKAAVRQFCWWFRENDLRTRLPEVASLDSDRNLLQKYFSWQLTRVAVSTAESHLSGMSVFWRALHELGLVQTPCPHVRQKALKKQAQVEKPDFIPIGISFADAKRWSDSFESIPIAWLKNWFRKNGWDVSPKRFVQLVLGCSLFYGLNIGDLVAIKEKHRGLQWSDIHRGPIPPFRGAETIANISWARGWIRIHRNKTGNEVWVPICQYLEELLRMFEGCDETMVFPMPNECSAAWYRTLRNGKKAAGLYHSQAALKEAEEKNIVEVYDISMSDKAPSRSCRKRTAILWKQCGNRSQASHMLAHSTVSGKVSREDLAAANDVASEMTERHYGGSEIYPDIVATAPKVEAEIESHLQLMCRDASAGDCMASVRT